MRLKLLKIVLIIVRFFLDLFPPLSKMRGIGDLLTWFFHTGFIGRLVFVITGMSEACPLCKLRAEKLNKLIPFPWQKEAALQEVKIVKRGPIVRKLVVKDLDFITSYNIPIGTDHLIKVQIFEKIFDTISGKEDDNIGKEILKEFEKKNKPCIKDK